MRIEAISRGAVDALELAEQLGVGGDERSTRGRRPAVGDRARRRDVVEGAVELLEAGVVAQPAARPRPISPEMHVGVAPRGCRGCATVHRSSSAPASMRRLVQVAGGELEADWSAASSLGVGVRRAASGRMSGGGGRRRRRGRHAGAAAERGPGETGGEHSASGWVLHAERPFDRRHAGAQPSRRGTGGATLRAAALRSRGPTARGSSRRPARRRGPTPSRSSGAPGSIDLAPGATPGRRRRSSPHTPVASPARKAAPSVVASTTGETSTGRPVASASAWVNVGLALIPPSTRSVVDRQAGVGLGRLDEVGAAVGDALEHGPHDVGRGRAPGEAEQRAARAVVPRRRAEAEQRRHVDDAVGRRRTADGDVVALGGSSRCRPRSSRSHSTLVPADSMIASTPHVSAPPCDQATIGNVPCAPRRADAGASGPRQTSSIPPVPNVILARPGRDAALADERRLLVADEGGDRRRAGQRRRRADHAARVDDASAACAAGMPSGVERAVVPCRGVGGEQAGDGGVGVVGDVERAAATASTPATCRRCRSTGRGRGRRRRGRAATPPWWPTGWARGPGRARPWP